MTDKIQKIKQEIERLINDKTDGKHVAKADIIAPKGAAYLDILNFINSLPEEPASEDLEEAAKRYATEGDEISGLYIIDEEVDAFKAGAEWQKKKDQETIELAEDHAMLAGINKMKEEMMKDAVDGEYWDGSIYLDNRPTEYKDGDEVKIIIIKPEQQ